MATMKDVARLAGVSVATVSATISGKKFVSQELKDRVLAAISEINYRPSLVASNLKLGRTSLVGLVIPDISNPFYTDIVAEVQRVARADGFSVTLGISDQDPERESEQIEYLLDQKVEALLVCSCGYGGETAVKLKSATAWAKLVLIDSVPEGIEADSVELDNFTAGKIAADHILSFGHEMIGVIAGPSYARSSEERVRGFEQAMNDAGHVHDPGLRERGNFQIEGGYEAAMRLLDRTPMPTAIFAGNNPMLIGVMRALSDRKLRVPDDMSIASVDDFPWASAFRPTITTVRQPTAEMARTAYELARARIDGFDGPFARKILAPQLIVRASCAAPAAS